MNQENDQAHDESIREEYDFRSGVRGKYTARFAKGSDIVVLDEDVARVFPDSASVTRRCGSWCESLNDTATKRIDNSKVASNKPRQQLV